MTVKDIIDQHSAMNYDVFMLGFLPGQPYLGEINEGLRLPRRTSPRLRIPAGSVGIATSLTCVFPSETPCGWHIIGRSPIPMWNMDQEQSPLFAPGDRVRLEPIGLSAFERLSLAVTHEGFRLSPDHGSALCLAH
jgi:KipI family sensor histidine kinase inhibitor